MRDGFSLPQQLASGLLYLAQRDRAWHMTLPTLAYFAGQEGLFGASEHSPNAKQTGGASSSYRHNTTGVPSRGTTLTSCYNQASQYPGQAYGDYLVPVRPAGRVPCCL